MQNTIHFIKLLWLKLVLKERCSNCKLGPDLSRLSVRSTQGSTKGGFGQTPILSGRIFVIIRGNVSVYDSKVAAVTPPIVHQ